MKPDTVYPPERDKLISETPGSESRLERYAVWKLLETAINQSFHYRMEDICFWNNKGKWSCDKLCFSLSHTRGVVAVAVSNAPCGVDIESVERFERRYSSPDVLRQFQNKLCADDEMLSLANPMELIELWTKKECLYKCYGTKEYFTRKISTSIYSSTTETIFLPDKYVISFCGDALKSAQIHIL